MSEKRKSLVCGDALLQALRKMSTTSFVKWTTNSDPHPVRISRDQAICIVRHSTYEGTFRKGRVYCIRELDTRTPNILDPEYRQGRAMLQFIPVTKRTVDLWDLHFAKASSATPASSN